MKKKQNIMFEAPGREAVAEHFNNGGNIRIAYAAGYTILNKNSIGNMFSVDVDSFSLADVVKNGYNHQGDLTLSIEK